MWQRATVFGGALHVLMLGACTDPLIREHAALSTVAEPLRSDFNRDADAVRLVILAAPTCETSFQGIFAVDNDVLQAEPDERLRVFVVWVPMMYGRESNVPSATRSIPDIRTKHYWDGSRALVDGFRAPLSLQEPAWNVYLLYAPGAKWQDAPPPPDFWMHQLTAGDGLALGAPTLNATVLRERVRALLNGGDRSRMSLKVGER